MPSLLQNKQTALFWIIT